MATTEDLDFAMPFNGDSTLGVPGPVGPYSAEDHSLVWRGGISHLNSFDNRGPVRDTFNEWQIAAVGGALQATIDTGACFVRGVYGQTTAIKTLDVPANNTGNPRLDRIVIRRNGAAATNELELAVKTGTAVAYDALVQSALDDGVFEIPLWKWSTPNAAADLTGVTFIDERNWSSLPYVTAPLLTNGTGNDLIVGTVAVQDTGATTAFQTTTTVGDPDAIGITIGGEIASGATGRVATNGVVPVRVTGAVAIGDKLQASATPGVAQFAANDAPYFAIAMEAAAGPGLGAVQALLQRGGKMAGAVRRAAGQVFVLAGGFSSVVWQTELLDTFGMVDLVAANTRITVQQDGIYQINATWNEQGLPNNLGWQARIWVNGGTQLHIVSGSHDNVFQQSGAISGIWAFNNGDFVELQFQCGVGGANYTIESVEMSVWRAA